MLRASTTGPRPSVNARTCPHNTSDIKAPLPWPGSSGSKKAFQKPSVWFQSKASDCWPPVIDACHWFSCAVRFVGGGWRDLPTSIEAFIAMM